MADESSGSASSTSSTSGPKKKKGSTGRPRGRPRKDGSAPRAETQAAPAEKAASWKAGSLQVGAQYLVQLLWLLSKGVAWAVGGKLDPLTDDELKAGGAAAVPLVQRFAWLAVLLTFAGLPLWFLGMVALKFKFLPKPPKKQAEQKPPEGETQKQQEEPAAETSPGATVHPIRV